MQHAVCSMEATIDSSTLDVCNQLPLFVFCECSCSVPGLPPSPFTGCPFTHSAVPEGWLAHPSPPLPANPSNTLGWWFGFAVTHWMFFLKIPGPVKSWKITLVLESPGIKA